MNFEAGTFTEVVWRLERGGRVLEETAEVHPDRPYIVPSRLFDLASLTKLFTTTAVLRLATLGQLKLEDRLADHLNLPFLGNADLRSALSHSTGYHPWYPFYTRKEPFEGILEAVFREHAPTGQTVYSDLNFMLLGRVIEHTTRLPLKEAMAQLVLAPLGLSHTSYGPCNGASPTEWGNRIEKGMVQNLGLTFEAWRPEDEPIQGACNDGNAWYFFGGVAGHAGLFGDAADLCALGRLYLNGGLWRDEAYLAADLVTEACQDRGTGRGLGFQFGDLYPEAGFGHTGFTGTYLYLNPQQNLVGALLTNRLNGPTPGKIDEFRRNQVKAALQVWGRSN